MKVEDWLQAARADAKRRELPELEPLLEALARATQNLRREDTENASVPDDQSVAGTTR